MVTASIVKRRLPTQKELKALESCREMSEKIVNAKDEWERKKQEKEDIDKRQIVERIVSMREVPHYSDRSSLSAGSSLDVAGDRRREYEAFIKH